MGKMQYDESGNAGLYFVFFMYGMACIPLTYFLWPSLKSKLSTISSTILLCMCASCKQKRYNKDSQHYWRKRLIFSIKTIMLILIWALFLYLAFRALTLKNENEVYDPWAALEIEQDATLRIIKKQYYLLSKIYHPDRPTGDHNKFMAIAKAYETLTDPVKRENFDKYGDPDGPRSFEVGIALPTWIIDKGNSMWVLIVYGLCFLVLMPAGVSIWWYRSMKYSTAQVITETSQIFGYCLRQFPQNNMHKIIMILTCALEFNAQNNKQMTTEREEDSIELNTLGTKLFNAKHKINIKPFNFYHATKARLIVYAYLENVPISPHLVKERDYILSRCSQLLEHMTTICTELMAYFKYQQSLTGGQKKKGKRASQLGKKGPSMNTLENILRLGQYLSQKLPVGCSLPLLQLPHLSEEDLKHFVTKKRKIRSLQELGSLGEEERRLLLRRLTDEEYDDVNNVLSGLPHIEMNIELEVIDILDKSRVTAGALVTVNVYLLRNNLLQQNGENEDNAELQPLENDSEFIQNSILDGKFSGDNTLELENNGVIMHSCNDKQYHAHTSKGNKKSKQGKSSKSSNKSVDNKVRNRKSKSTNKITTNAPADQKSKVCNNEEIEILEEPMVEDSLDEDKEFEMLQKTILKKDKAKNQSKDSNKKSHLVHCPYFKEDRYEGWWIYMTDPKKGILTAAPKYIPDLINSYETDLKFQAPTSTGKYQYRIHLVSDSYIGLDVAAICQFTVYAAATDLDEYDYGIDDIDNEADNDLIEQVETTSDEGSELNSDSDNESN